MSKETKGNVFNILYWNINYRTHQANSGRQYKNENIRLSSKIIIEQIKQFIDSYHVNVVVLTEAWPFNSVISSNKIHEFLHDEGFILPGYYDLKKENIEMFVNSEKKSLGDRKEKYYNSVILAVKYSDGCFNDWIINQDSPNFLGIVSGKKLLLGGVRIGAESKEIDRINQLKKVENLASAYEKVIIVGDYNIESEIEPIKNNLYINNINPGYVVCEKGYTMANMKIDHLYLKNVKPIKFESILDMKDLYGNKITRDIFYEVVSILPPFPDHNLLFASVDLGSD